jgi:outer membrane lipoprotein LolB
MPTLTQENAEAALAYQARFDQLQSLEHWTLGGRLAISDGKEGGSGSLLWQNDGDETQMSFHGTMGKGAWQLQAGPAGARIELANGETHLAPTIAALVLQQVGWQVPVDALSWWVKGLADPGKWESRQLDEKGQLVKLSQFGWEVEFGNYGQVSGSWLPSKLTARRGKYLVKMVVRTWHLQAEAG